jgi:hypothetical protein
MMSYTGKTATYIKNRKEENSLYDDRTVLNVKPGGSKVKRHFNSDRKAESRMQQICTV